MARSSALIAQYARIGAKTRLNELRAEIAEIERAFPGLGAPARRKPGRPRAGANTDDGQTVGTEARSRKLRRRKPMTAAQKAQVSKRMKAYWAQRRNAKTTATKAKRT